MLKNMKKIFLFLFGIIVLFLVLSAVMFVFKLCPPKGPWITPPWCSAGFIRYNYSVSTNPIAFPQIKAVNMSDTWGRNYNMNMIESTRDNIVSSFSRVKELGVKEVYVNDFDRAVFDDGADFTTTQYTIVDEIFLNDMRDEAMTENDIKTLVETAHAQGLLLGIKRNMSFVNIGKYISAGIKGEIQANVEADYEKFNSSHTEEWIRDYFNKWNERMMAKATLYQKYGVDIMSITPTWMGPTFTEHETLANELQKKLIADVRKVFKGKVHVEVSRFGFFENKDGNEDWMKYDYYKDADVVEISIRELPEKYRDGEMEVELPKYLADLNRVAGEKQTQISLFFAPSSYRDSMKHGSLEVLDYNSDAVKNAVADYEYQSKVFEIFFSSLPLLSHIERTNVGSFSWDDALDPEVKPKLSVASTFRNKPAEEIIKAWFTK